MSVALPERIRYSPEIAPEVVAVALPPPIQVGRRSRSEIQSAVKRAIDIFLAFAALAAVSPVLLVAAIGIKLDTPGPVFYRQRRLGQHGRVFWLLKFRTMHDGSDSRLAEIIHLNEASGPLFKSRNDPRVTRVGRVLRSHFLDEIPQFFNVLKGDMSLVGPRPCLPSELAAHPDDLWFRLAVPQGMTGPWQTSGHHDLTFDEQLEVERDYVAGWTLLRDIAIVRDTVSLVLRGKGI